MDNRFDLTTKEGFKKASDFLKKLWLFSFPRRMAAMETG